MSADEDIRHMWTDEKPATLIELVQDPNINAIKEGNSNDKSSCNRSCRNKH